MPGVVDDLRHGVRALLRAPGFCALALLTLALGIGGTSAMFSVVYGVLHRPLPFQAPDELVRLWHTSATGGRGSFSPAVYLDLEREARSLAGVAGYISTAVGLTGGADPARLRAAEVTAGFFDVLGASPIQGRAFSRRLDPPAGPPLVVLSEAAWQQHFGGDPGVVGRTIHLDGRTFDVVGVMPRAFDFPRGALLWRLAPQAVPTPPLQVEGELLSSREVGYMDVVGRLAPGTRAGAASSDLRLLASSLADRYPVSDANRGFDVEPLHDTIVGTVRPSLLVLFGAIGTVLLIACTNVASLMLVRALGRRRELAVRTALGAPRGRLVRQLLIECLLLALAGGALGVVVAAWALEGLRVLLPASVPRVAEVRLDLTVVAFAALVSLLVGLAFGTAPAWLGAALSPVDALREGGRTSTAGRHWVRRGLVIGRVTLAVVLLAAAGVMGTSLLKLQRADVGFTAEGVVTQQVVLPQSRYDRAAQARFYERVTERLRADPRVTAASVVFPSPLVSSAASATIHLDRPAPGEEAAREHTVSLVSISSQYFRSMGIPLLAGRDFEPRDLPQETKNIIVNEALAERLLGGSDVLERRLQFGDDDTDWYTVVGVVADARAARLDAAAEPIAYLPYTHLTIPFMRLLARGAGPESATRDALLEALRAEAPDLVQDPPETLTTIVLGATAEPRFRSGMVGAFAAAALGLAVLGLYGLSTYTVSGRTREIATRLALGATPRSMRAGVIREGLTLTGVGLAAGIGIAAVLGRLIDGLLYETAAADPFVIGLLAALMAAASIVACYLPARRAMRVDPVMALRAE